MKEIRSFHPLWYFLLKKILFFSNWRSNLRVLIVIDYSRRNGWTICCLSWGHELMDFSFKTIWVNLFKNGPSNICGRLPLKNFTWSNLEYLDLYENSDQTFRVKVWRSNLGQRFGSKCQTFLRMFSSPCFCQWNDSSSSLRKIC